MCCESFGMTVLQTLVTKNSPSVAVGRTRGETTNAFNSPYGNRITTLCTPLTTYGIHMFMGPNLEAEILNILKIL